MGLYCLRKTALIYIYSKGDNIFLKNMNIFKTIKYLNMTVEFVF